MLKQAKDKIIVASAMSELKGAMATACCCGRGQMSNEQKQSQPQETHNQTLSTGIESKVYSVIFNNLTIIHDFCNFTKVEIQQLLPQKLKFSLIMMRLFQYSMRKK